MHMALANVQSIWEGQVTKHYFKTTELCEDCIALTVSVLACWVTNDEKEVMGKEDECDLHGH